ncbi:MAG: hypothetical protein M0Z51_00585 [Propionibacterium sp.]|nr:hypothetical protein [Propionibacterium sp.]
MRKPTNTTLLKIAGVVPLVAGVAVVYAGASPHGFLGGRLSSQPVAAASGSPSFLDSASSDPSSPELGDRSAPETSEATSATPTESVETPSTSETPGRHDVGSARPSIRVMPDMVESTQTSEAVETSEMPARAESPETPDRAESPETPDHPWTSDTPAPSEWSAGSSDPSPTWQRSAESDPTSGSREGD